MGCVLGTRAASDHRSNSNHRHNNTQESTSTINTQPTDGVEKTIRHISGDVRPSNRGKLKLEYSLHTPPSWPTWLSAVAGDVIKDWTPRRANTFEKLDKIGQGTYSNVYKARDLITGKIVALKKVRVDTLEPENVKFMAREILILKKLYNHPNIIKLEGLVTSRMSSSLYLVFEYMEHDLSGLAAVQGLKFTEPQIKCLIKQLLSGLEHCHRNGVLHRDIKGSNLLIDDDGILKIADFGLASFYDPQNKQPMTSRVVTLWYRPPELLLGATNYGVGVDMWSAGCILAELLAGKPIMPGRTEVEQLHKIFKLCGSPSEEYWKKHRLPNATLFKPRQPYKRCTAEVFKDFPSSSLPLLESLLAIDPDERSSAAASLNSDFFTTEPYACEPSELPKYPPSKELDVKLRDEEARRRRGLTGKSQVVEGNKKPRTRDRVGLAVPAPEANAEIQSNLDRWRVVNQSNAKCKSEKFPPPHRDAAVGHAVDPTHNGGPVSFGAGDDTSFNSSVFDTKPTKSVSELGAIGGPSRRNHKRERSHTASSLDNVDLRKATKEFGKENVSKKESKKETNQQKRKKSKEHEDIIPEEKRMKIASVAVTRKPKEKAELKYFPFTHQKMNLRCSPGNLTNFIESLNEDQKKAVIEMGFGETLCINIHTIPTAFGFWLLENYDPTTNIVNDGTHNFQITTSLINEVFGIPNGGLKVETKFRPNSNDPVINEWRSQFGENVPKKIFIKDFSEYVLKLTDSGRMFKLNFLVMFFTVMGEAMMSNTVNQRFLRSVTTKTDVRSLNWCDYMLGCLVRTRLTWSGGVNELYTGPMLALAILYIYKRQQICSKGKWRKRGNMLEKIDYTTLAEFEDNFLINKRTNTKEETYKVVKEVKESKRSLKVVIKKKKDTDVLPQQEEAHNQGDVIKKKKDTDVLPQQEEAHNQGDVIKKQKDTDVLPQQEEAHNQGDVVLEIESAKDDTMETEEIRAQMLKKELMIFDEHGKKFERLLQKAINDFPDGKLVRQKEREWALLVKKYQKIGQTEGITLDTTEQNESIQAKAGEQTLEEQKMKKVAENVYVVKRKEDLVKEGSKNEKEITMEGPKHNENVPTHQDEVHNQGIEDKVGEDIVDEKTMEGLKENIPTHQDEAHNQVKGIQDKLDIQVCEVSESEIIELIRLEQEATSTKKTETQKETVVNFFEPPSFELGLSQPTPEEVVEVHNEEAGINEVEEHNVKESTMEGIKHNEKVDVDTVIKELPNLQQEDGYTTPAKNIVHFVEPISSVKPQQFEENKTKRPQRNKNFADALCSPYILREVAMAEKRTVSENNVSTYLFTGNGNIRDALFLISDVILVSRVKLESLIPGVEIHEDVINVWSHILNKEEKKKSRESDYRLFCTAPMIEKDTYDKDEQARVDEFTKNMTDVLRKENLKTIKKFDLVFVPIIQSKHCYLMCFNIKEPKTILIDNIASGNVEDMYNGWPEKMKHAFEGYLDNMSHPKAKSMKDTSINILEMPWRTSSNDVDSGIFLMRHMETYMGEKAKNWACGFAEENSNEHEAQIIDLRRKYTTKILLHDINENKAFVIEMVKKYLKEPAAEKRRLQKNAKERIMKRLNEEAKLIKV